VLPARHGKDLLPPTMQAVALIRANDKRALPGLAARLRGLELRPNLLARRDGRPSLKRPSGNLKDETKGPAENRDKGLHANGAIVAGAGAQASPPFCSMAQQDEVGPSRRSVAKAEVGQNVFKARPSWKNDFKLCFQP